MSSYDPFDNFLNTISTKPQRLADTPVDEPVDERSGGSIQDAITRGMEMTAAEEARVAAAYALRRKYRAEEGDPSNLWKRPLPRPRVPIDPKWAGAPQSENVEDVRQVYRSPFLDRQMYEYFSRRGAPPATQGEMPGLPSEDLRARAIEQLSQTMNNVPGAQSVSPGQLEVDAGRFDATWPNAYDQMVYEGRAPAYPPREKPLTADQYDQMMQGADDPTQYPKPVPAEVDG